MSPVFSQLIHSFGGLSYEAGELLLGKFSDFTSANECALEINYLFSSLPIEIDGNWIAIYLCH